MLLLLLTCIFVCLSIMVINLNKVKYTCQTWLKSFWPSSHFKLQQIFPGTKLCLQAATVTCGLSHQKGKNITFYWFYLAVQAYSGTQIMILLFVMSWRAHAKKPGRELLTFLHVQLAEAINLQDRSLSAQLHETIRSVKDLQPGRYKYQY